MTSRPQKKWKHYQATFKLQAITMIIVPPKTVSAVVGLLISLPTAIASSNCTSKDPRIELGYATYFGKSLHNGVDQFIGMRYAAAPIGDLRWRSPAPPEEQGIQLAQEVSHYSRKSAGKQKQLWKLSMRLTSSATFASEPAKTRPLELAKTAFMSTFGSPATLRPNPSCRSGSLFKEEVRRI